MTNTRNILLIGRTGGGKSTLANVLTNTNKFGESSSTISATKKIQVELTEIDLAKDGSEKLGYQIIDTIGIGDTEMTPQGVLIKLAEMASLVKKKGLNQILFVTGGRFTKEEIETYDLLSSIIFDKDVLKYTTVVRTGFPEFEDKEACDNDRAALRKENAELAHILGEVNIIYLDNPPLKGKPKVVEINKETREESRKRLLTYLGGCQGTYRPSNIDTLDERVKDYTTNEEKLHKKMEELEKARKEQEEEFRKKIANLKEEQAKELRENRRKFEEDIHKVKVDGEENLRKTKNELEDTHRREIADHDQRNENKIQGLKSNYEREAKSIKDAAAQHVQNLQGEMQRDRSKIDSLEKKLSEKSSSSNTEMLTLITKMEESARIREDKAEERRLRYEERRDQQTRETEQKRIDAENTRIQDDKDREERRQQREEERELRHQEEKRELEAKVEQAARRSPSPDCKIS